MVKLRNTKITVCINCRTRKVKCGRQKPICVNCKTLGLACVFDTVEPPAPVVANVAPLPMPDPPGWSASLDLNLPPLLTGSSDYVTHSFSETQTSSVPSNLLITLKDYPKPVVIIYESSKYFADPLCMVGNIQKDVYLRAFSASLHGLVFIEYSCRGDAGIENWLTSISFKQNNMEEKSLLTFLDKLVKRFEQKGNKIKPELWTPNVLFWNDFLLPDELTNDNMPPFLFKILSELEQTIPDVATTDFLLQHFYDTIWPVHCYLDLKYFKKYFDKVMTSNGKNYTIQIGKDEIRKKVLNLAIFLIIMKIAHCSLSITGDPVLKKMFTAMNKESTMSGAVVVLGQKLYSLLNTMDACNEDGLVFLVYLNVCENFYMENEHVCLLQKEKMVLDTMHDVSILLGLQRDMNLFPQIAALKDFDDDYIFQRKKLYLGTTTWRLDRALTSGYGTSLDIKEIELFIQENNSFVVDPSYNFLMKKLKFFLMLLKLNNVSCNESNFSLNSFERLIKNCENILVCDFPLADMSANPKFSSEILSVNLLGRICLLNQSHLLLIYFEGKSFLDPFEYSGYQGKYMIESFRYILEIFELVINYLEGKYISQIPESMAYLIKPKIVDALLKCWLFLIAMILRLKFCAQMHQQILASHSMAHLGSKYSANTQETIKVHLQKLEDMANSCTELLRYGVQLTTLKLATEYFSCYQITCVVSYVVHLLDMDKLVDATERLWKYLDHIPADILSMLQLKWGISISETTEVVSRLKSTNILNGIEVNVLDSMHDIMDGFNFLFKNTSVVIPNILDNSTISELLQNDLDQYFDFWENGLSSQDGLFM